MNLNLLMKIEPAVVQVKLTDAQVEFVAITGAIVVFFLAAVLFAQFKKP